MTLVVLAFIILVMFECFFSSFSMWFMARELTTSTDPSQGAHTKGPHPFFITSMPNPEGPRELNPQPRPCYILVLEDPTF